MKRLMIWVAIILTLIVLSQYDAFQGLLFLAGLAVIGSGLVWAWDEISRGNTAEFVKSGVSSRQYSLRAFIVQIGVGLLLLVWGGLAMSFLPRILILGGSDCYVEASAGGTTCVP